jgi:flavin reductase (DIM6/NTAB) family NADH-FMN oxidoreductase RutF
LGDPYTTLNSCAVVACKVVQRLDLGSHIMFVGEVADAQRIPGDEPITYAYYHSVLKGKTPPKASSYIADQEA